MNTLIAVSPLLTRLFAEADETSARIAERVRHMPGFAAAMSDPNADFRGFYHHAKDLHLAVSPATGRLLYMLARANGARNVIEFGTSFGLSTIHLAAAIRDNGGGRLIGSEYESSKIEGAFANLRAAGLAELVDIREGDALETLARDLPDTIDFVLLDGAKPLYRKVIALLESRLRNGALIVADNADHCPEYLAHVRSPESGYLSVPFTGDVELSIRLRAASEGT